MPRPEDGRAGPVGEREQLGEAKVAVAPAARVRCQSRRVAGDERADDRVAELLAQVERDMRQAESVTRLACGDHGVGRAAGALGARALRIEPQA